MKSVPLRKAEFVSSGADPSTPNGVRYNVKLTCGHIFSMFVKPPRDMEWLCSECLAELTKRAKP